MQKRTSGVCLYTKDMVKYYIILLSYIILHNRYVHRLKFYTQVSVKHPEWCCTFKKVSTFNSCQFP